MDNTLNILTIDVEDYYHVSGMESVINRRDWDRYESRVVSNTRKILHILGKVKATFFILGWVAERYPEMVLDIKRAGHEIASHGYGHRLIYNQSEGEFYADLKRSMAILESITGEQVIGYRAPSASVTKDTLWALDIVQALGLRYDSSIFPVVHDRYGIPNAKRFPHIIRNNMYGKLWEFPLSTVQIMGRNIPIAGGGYFRLFSYGMTKWCIKRLNEQGYPAVVYLHPWEFDPHQPRQKPQLINRIRHYINLDKTENRLKALLRDFKFVPMREFL